MSSAARASSPRLGVSEIALRYDVYARTFLKIATKRSALLPLDWNRPQEKLAAAVQWQVDRSLPIRVVVLKSRRVGISTWIQGFMFHRCHLRSHRVALTIAHEEKSALELFNMQKLMYEELPKEGPISAPKQYFSKRQIQFKDTRSRTQIAVVGKGAGRGFNVPYLHLSEMAFYEDAGATLQAVKQGVPKIADSAVFIESTPKGWGNAFHKSYARAKSGKSDYIAVFIAWFDDPTCEMAPWFTEAELDDAERALVAEHAVGLRQLAWRRNTIENECDGDINVFLEEYPSDDESCFLASGRPAIVKDDMKYQLDALPQPDPYAGLRRCEIVQEPEIAKPVLHDVARGRLTILDLPKPRRHYIVGVDPSEGDPGSTASPITVLDQHTLGFPALWYGRTPPEYLAEHAVRICMYYNEALLIWEANNHGLAFGMCVRELGYHNVWMREVSPESVAGERTLKPGYMNTERNRQHLFDTLGKFAREARKHSWPPVRHPQIVEEMQSLVYEGDKAVGREGSPTDCCIAASLCLYCHRGDSEAALEPLTEDYVRRSMSDISAKLRMGIMPTQEELEQWDVTMEELERVDELRYNRSRAESRRGLGGSV